MSFTINHDSSDNQRLTIASRLNWLRAAVLGANDGIVSVAGIVVGVAAATNNKSIILTAGLAGLIAGALSMAVGEYVSVSSQRDTQESLIETEKDQLSRHPARELKELALMYEAKGLSKPTAQKVAAELTAHDPIAAHVDAEFSMDVDELTNAWHAAIASALSFALGAGLPVGAIFLAPTSIQIPVAFMTVVVALIMTGILSAWVGNANKIRATVRIVIGGILAMIITFGAGTLFTISGV